VQVYFLSGVRGLIVLEFAVPIASLREELGLGSKRLVSLLFTPVYVRVTLFIPRQIFRRVFFCPEVSRCAGAVLRRFLFSAMKVLRAIIVDDEFSSRRLLAKLLSAHAEISVVGEARSVEEAVSLCAQLRPAVIFLDVNMPKQSGLELMALLEEKPDVVFVTAHIAYMSEAFGVGACDYLLKPVSAKRLEQAVKRLVALSLGNK
jgi:CheY-like chemotaxis protein